MSENAFKDILLFTDGACSGNPGPGGWGSVLVLPEGHVRELGDFVPETTNNRMEMVAALRGLDEVADRAEPVRIYTDSTYLIRGITQWIWGWRRNGWKTAEGSEVQNKDLWILLDQVLRARPAGGPVEWNYVRGHRGNPGNERCDEIAVGFSKGPRPRLFDGSLLKYPLPILDLPESEGLPEMRPKEEKKAAYSYLSLLGGQVVRHKDWASCERRVKGRSGAKFKKAMSAADEVSILESWGLSSSHVSDENGA